MKLCILDAWDSVDPALLNSHWVAEQTICALSRELPNATLQVVSGDGVDGARVDMELLQAYEGFAYFGHGREHLLYRCRDASGAPIALFGREHVQRLGHRWFHAFACLSGHSLCQDAADAGAGAFLGYHATVNVTWDVPELPTELRVLLADLVTVATLKLAHGERSRDVIRRSVRAVSDQLLDWLDTHEDAVMHIDWIDITALQMLANTLHQKLELQGTSVLP